MSPPDADPATRRMTAVRRDVASARTAAVPFARALERHGSRLAVRTGGVDVTYSQLASLADERAERLGAPRKLVLLRPRNDLPSLVTYLAALRHGHPVLLAPPGPGADDPLVATYHPDLVVEDGRDLPVRGLAPGPAERPLHPDLALLLSTSGSTGSPKLVRLSHANVQANADAIVEVLGLGPEDRAMTSLPMHYCFGLSVINSHLSCGASLVLDERSVVEPGFWETFRATGATSFAGVPYTFDLLDRIGFADLDLPHLRHVQQAGGRLAPAQVRRYASLGRARGWQLFVMYGQTEATARMAYLPPELADRHPESIGLAVPGGRFDLEPVDGLAPADGGELVYRGPNVMLGYAEGPDDLALGRTVDRLRTGDLARRNGAGLYEIVGRRSRFTKLFGVRLDLDRVERALAEHERTSLACTGDDERLVVAAVGAVSRDGLLERIHHRFGVPPIAVQVMVLPDLPRLASGKIDYAAIEVAAARERARSERSPSEPAGTDGAVRAVYVEVLRNGTVGTADTFTSLGGDSLSYVELSVRLEETLGHLPEDWPSRTIAELERLRVPAGPSEEAARPPSRRRQIETNVVLRAAAVIAVVGTHAGLFRVKGGAHLLLALAGFNFARFQLAAGRRNGTAPRLGRSLGRVALPTAAWLAVLLAATDDYDLANLFLLYSHVGEAHWDQRWRYWYVEALLQILVAAAVVLRVPAVRRAERAAPFGFALATLAAALAWRVHLFDVGGITRATHRPQTVLWIFVLGWAAGVAGSRRQKLVVGLVALAATPGFFVDDGRAALLVGGTAVLLAVPTVRVPGWLARAAATVASASLYVYLTHWQVYPAVVASFPPIVALGACLAVGIAVARVVELSLGARAARSRSASSAGAGATARVPAG